jgi:hypothetical protein
MVAGAGRRTRRLVLNTAPRWQAPWWPAGPGRSVRRTTMFNRRRQDDSPDRGTQSPLDCNTLFVCGQAAGGRPSPGHRRSSYRTAGSAAIFFSSSACRIRAEPRADRQNEPLSAQEPHVFLFLPPRECDRGKSPSESCTVTNRTVFQRHSF